MPHLGQWVYRVDPPATRKAYAMSPVRGVDICDCLYCQNFRIARDRVLPEPFLQLLQSLGIDPSKEGEIYEVHRHESGLHIYSGWYHFVGELIEDGAFTPVVLSPSFRVWLTKADAPRIATLKDADVVQLEFDCDAVPWLLDEQDLTSATGRNLPLDARPTADVAPSSRRADIPDVS